MFGSNIKMVGTNCLCNHSKANQNQLRLEKAVKIRSFLREPVFTLLGTMLGKKAAKEHSSSILPQHHQKTLLRTGRRDVS